MTKQRWITPAELAAGPPLDDDPLWLVALDAPADRETVAAAAKFAETGSRILVGVAGRVPDPGLAAALDLTLAASASAPYLIEVADPTGAAGELHMAAWANPQAASVLTSLLRWSGTLPARWALDAESLAYSTLLGGPEFRRWLEHRGPRPLPPPAPADPVLVSRDDAELHVTLNRPERRNAYGREVRDALVTALEIAVLDTSVEHVVLDGAGPVFSSGGDLDEFGTTPDIATAHFVRTRAGAGLLLHDIADRVEARVHGTCVGAGIELPAFAHRVVAAPGTTFRLPEVGMGLIPGAGGTVSIARRIGRWRTLYLALTGTALDAATALKWGLIDRIAR